MARRAFANLPIFRLVGLLESWRAGSEGGRARAQDRSTSEKRGGHTRRYLPQKRGEEERGAPTQNRHSHRNSEEKANEEEQPASTPPHGGGQHMSRKAPYRPESGSTKVSANASMKASRPCSAPRKGWPGYLNRKRSYQETYPVKTLCGRYHRPKPKRETGRTGFHYSPSPNESPVHHKRGFRGRPRNRCSR